MRLNKLSIENLMCADRAEISLANTVVYTGYFVKVYLRSMSSYLQGNSDITFPNKQSAMRTIRRYRKDMKVTSFDEV